MDHIKQLAGCVETNEHNGTIAKMVADLTELATETDTARFNASLDTIIALAQELRGPTKPRTMGTIVRELIDFERAGADDFTRYSLFPIKDFHGYKLWKCHENFHWVNDELEFSRDRRDYNEKASPAERALLDKINSFFMVGDGFIADNIMFRLMLELKTYEEKCYIANQLDREMVHAETYGLIAATLKSEKELLELLTQASNSAPIRAKGAFMYEYTTSDESLGTRLAAFACAEGIFFSVLFCCVFWWRSRGIFHNIILANEFISRDEGCHTMANIVFSNKYGGVTKYRKVEIVRQAVAIEELFIDYLLPEPIRELNSTGMRQYLYTVADRILYGLDCEPIYHAKNPYPWMDEIANVQKNNFYEIRSGTYNHGSMSEVMDRLKQAGASSDDQDEERTRLRKIATDPATVIF